MVETDGEDAMIEQRCVICTNGSLIDLENDYLRCGNCKHESLKSSAAQSFIVNDSLSISELHKVTSLDKYKSGVLSFCRNSDVNEGNLVDIGSGSGKFLYQNKKKFSAVCGLEITPECVEFSRDVLKLNIQTSIEDTPLIFDAVTAWHSLEHIPVNALRNIMSVVAERIVDGGFFVVSVPNSDSRQYRWFKKSYAYYDNPNHLHQFSNKSLDILFEQYGFVRDITFQTGPYNRFGYIQAILNKLTGAHNYLYSRLKRKNTPGNLKDDLKNLAILPFAVPVGLLLWLLDLNAIQNQGVITACYKKKIC